MNNVLISTGGLLGALATSGPAWELVRWPVELALAATACLGVAGLAAILFRKKSAAFRAHLWLLGFVATAVFLAMRFYGAHIAVAVLPAPLVASAEQQSRGPATSTTENGSSSAKRQMAKDRGALTRTAQGGEGGVSDAPGAPTDPRTTEQGEPERVTGWMTWQRMGFLWAAGAAWLLLRIVAGVVVLRRGAAAIQPVPQGSVLETIVKDVVPEACSRVRVGLHPGVRSPVSFGLQTCWILFPTEALQWSASRLKLVLTHELAHYERRDYPAVLVIRLVTAVCWFHPLAWWGSRQFRLLSESAADDRALENAEPSAYAGELLGLVQELRQGIPAFPAAATLSIGEPGTVKARIVAMLEPMRDRRRLSVRFSLMTAAAVLVVATLLPSLRLVARAADDKPVAQTQKSEAAANNSQSALAKDKEAGMEHRSDTRELILTIRDEDGAPVADAVLKPKGCRARHDEGSYYLWNPKVADAPVQSDATGRIVLKIPVYTYEDLETIGINVQVRHPDFCVLDTEISVERPLPVVLKRGATIAVPSVKLPAGTAAKGALKVAVELTPAKDWLRQLDWRPLPGTNGVATQVAPGSYALRAVAFDEAGSRYLSEPQALEVRKGENQSFEPTVSPAVTLKGRLSPEVPRPVKNGRIAVEIVSQLEGIDRICWMAGAEIRADGTFELTGVPKGEIQVVATCDGYVSRDPVGKRGILSTHPQIFAAAQADQIVVTMEKTGTAKLRVMTPQGQPLSGATVHFWPNQVFGGGSSILGRGFDTGAYLRAAQVERDWDAAKNLRTPEPSWSAQTDAEGWATVANLPPSEQDYGIEAEGWQMPVLPGAPGRLARRSGVIAIKADATASATVRMEAKGKSSLSEQMAKSGTLLKTAPATKQITTENGPALKSLQTGEPIPVAPGKDLTGRVVDEKGAPLAGVLVDVWTWCPGSETKTDAEGRFRLPDPGDEDRRDVEVKFSLAEFSPFHVTRQPVGALEKDVVLTKRPYFEGVVTDAAGKPVPDQLVRASAGQKEADGVSITDLWLETRTDAQGRYRLHVFPDLYRIEVRSKAGEVARIANQGIGKNDAVTLDIHLKPGLAFRALVVDAETGKPVQGVRLHHWEHPGVEGVSDAAGNLVIEGMFPGDFDFEVDAEKLGYRRWWSQAAQNDWERRKIETSGWQRNFDSLHYLLAKESGPVRIEMERGVKIRGTVRGPDGQIAKGATVAPAHTGSGNSLTGDTRFSVRSKGDGTFEMLLPASHGVNYNLVAHDGDYQEWRGLANGVLPPITTKPGQEIADVEIRLTKPCVVRGRVLDAAGHPVAGREVRAASADMLENRYYFPNTRTKADGTFELSFVRAGKQLIQAGPLWLNPKEAPEKTSVEVEATPEQPVTDVELIARKEE